MAALKNPRHELFAQAIAKGKSQIEAHAAAGFNPHRSNASKLARTANVIARIAELHNRSVDMERAATEKAAERLSIDREWVLSRLVENVNRAMQAVKAGGPKGDGPGEYRYDGAVANAALALIGKELGMFIERTENLNVERVVSDSLPTDEEWAAEHGAAH